MLCLVLTVGVTCTVMSVEFRFRLKRVRSLTSYDKNKLFSYDIIRGIQQATSISFFSPFLGNQRRLEHRSFLARSRVPPQRRNSREIG